MAKICIDFKVLLDYLRGDPITVEKIKHIGQEEDLYITAPTLADISLVIEDKTIIPKLLTVFDVLPLDEEAAMLVGEIYDEVEDSGRRPNLRRIVEASICIKNKSYLLVKSKKDYDYIPKLKLII